jgi:hypothetical protein
MPRVFNELYKKVKKIKKDILPNNTKNIIKLNNSMKKYLDNTVLKYPHKLHKFLVGGNKKDKITKTIMNTYTKINSDKIYDKLVRTKNLLNSILEKTHTYSKHSQKGGYYNLSFYEGSPQIFYLTQPYEPMNLSAIYPNFYIDDMNDFLSNRLYAIKMLSDNLITHTDTSKFFDHVKFMTTCILEFKRSYIYRFIDKNVLHYNLNLLDCIIRNHREFYEKFKFTIDMLQKFCTDLCNTIGDNILDISLLTPQYLESGEKWLLDLNYGIVALNGFKLLMDNIIKN